MEKRTYFIYKTGERMQQTLPIPPQNRGFLKPLHQKIMENYDAIIDSGDIVPSSIFLSDGYTVELVNSEEEEEMVSVCAWCPGVIEEKSYGDEGLSVCSECGAVEGGSRDMTISEYERMLG